MFYMETNILMGNRCWPWG